MKPFVFILILLGLMKNSFAQFSYPLTKTVDSSDTWHNITIKDPYRWMEDLNSDDTKNWFKQQNDYTNSILDKLPMTEELYKSFLKLDSIQPDKIGKVRQVGNVFFYYNQKLKDAKQNCTNVKAKWVKNNYWRIQQCGVVIIR
jgi:prolyl oligopeptidase